MMTKLKLVLLLAIVIGTSQCEEARSMARIADIGETLKEMVLAIGNVVSTFEKHHPSITHPHADERQLQAGEETTEPPVRYPDIKVDRTIRRMLNKVTEIIASMPKYPETIAETLDDMLEKIVEKLDLPDNNLQVLSNSLEKIHEHSTVIDRYYKDLIKFTEPRLRVAPSTINELVKAIPSYKNKQLISSVNGLRAYFEPRQGAFVYEAFMNYFNSDKKIPFDKKCDSAQSVQEELKKIYNLVMITEMRAFMMYVFAYKYEELTRLESTDNTITVQMAQILQRMSKYLLALKRITSAASREKIRCDPPEHYLDINCFRLTNLFGIYYLNERQVTTKCGSHLITPFYPVGMLEISNSTSSPTAYKYISSPIKNLVDPVSSNRNERNIESTTVINNKVACLDMSSHSQDLLVPKYCPERHAQCNGILHKCRAVPKASFCEADEGYGRRYQWINNGTNDISSIDCKGNYIDTMTVSKCDSFLCQCSEQGAKSSATRTVSLMPQVADIDNNMVVTNVRFQKKDNVVHLQIEQGQLLSEGKIKDSTTSWVPLPDLVYSQNVPEGSFWKKHDNGVSPLIYGLNYTFLTHNMTSLNLDDVIAAPGYVVTGVKLNFLKKSSKTPKSYLELLVHVTPYDYYLGQLRPTSDNPSKWISIRSSAGLFEAYLRFRKEVDLSNSDDSLKNPKNQIISDSNQSVDFQVTDYYKDFGQFTIPYFDSLPAGVASLSALGGVGIVHRGAKGFGGFLAPKLINVDHADFINSELSQQQIDHFTKY